MVNQSWGSHCSSGNSCDTDRCASICEEHLGTADVQLLPVALSDSKGRKTEQREGESPPPRRDVMLSATGWRNGVGEGNPSWRNPRATPAWGVIPQPGHSQAQGLFSPWKPQISQFINEKTKTKPLLLVQCSLPERDVFQDSQWGSETAYYQILHTLCFSFILLCRHTCDKV
jgi:hypothetical protein